jgi:hypothetical protein
MTDWSDEETDDPVHADRRLNDSRRAAAMKGAPAARQGPAGAN